MQLQLMDDAYWRTRREEMSREFPGARLGVLTDLTAEVVDAFEDALLAGPESAIQQVLTNHPYLIQYAIPLSGHHGIWAFPQQMIRPRAADGDAGMIPDFLVVSRSSLGDYWHVVELKRFDEQFSDAKGQGYSKAGHRAVSQCNGYLALFRDYIDAVRTNIRIPSMVQPSGAIIVIGDSGRETDRQRTNRSNFVRSSPNIDVVSYRRILLGARADVGFTPRGAGLLTTAGRGGKVSM